MFPNLRTNLSGWTNGIFSSCSGGQQGGGGLFGTGGSDEQEGKKEGLLASKEYELAFEEGVTLQIIEEAGFPMTGGDNSLSYGTYETDQTMEGHTVAFKVEPTTSEDKRIIGNFVMIGDGNPVKHGVVCYCGHNIYAFYEDEDDIGHKASTDFVWYANPDGKSFSIYDKGEEKMKWSLKD